MSLKEFAENKERKDQTVTTQEKNIVELFIEKQTTLSDDALVSLVVLHTSNNNISESCVKELTRHGLIEDNKLTVKGDNLLTEEDTIDKLKQIIEGSNESN